MDGLVVRQHLLGGGEFGLRTHVVAPGQGEHETAHDADGRPLHGMLGMSVIRSVAPTSMPICEKSVVAWPR